MLQLSLLFIVLHFVLRWLRRRKETSRSRPKYPPRAPRRAPTAPTGAVDEMKRCPSCGTYNPTRLAHWKNELYFCGEQCHEAYVQRGRRS